MGKEWERESPEGKSQRMFAFGQVNNTSHGGRSWWIGGWISFKRPGLKGLARPWPTPWSHSCMPLRQLNLQVARRIDCTVGMHLHTSTK